MKYSLITLLVLGLFCCGVGRQTSRLEPGYRLTKTGLAHQMLAKGSGPKVLGNDQVVIHEKLRYKHASDYIFSTWEMGHPVTIQLGAGQIIEGLEFGLVGMRKGELRALIIPPKFSERSEYPDFLHPDSTLYYTIELMEIVRE